MTFKGDKKVGIWFSHRLETRFKSWAVPKIPPFIETYHLTLCTVPITLLIIFFSYLAAQQIQWLWGVSFMIALQYLTDLLDGELGRYRKTGLVKWGFYMDHILDYLFLCSIFIGYSLLLPENYHFLQLFTLSLVGAFMVSGFLAFAATNQFKISFLGIGPTEIRLLFIIINTLLIYFEKTYLAWSLPYVLGAILLGLIIVIYKTQKELWKLDME